MGADMQPGPEMDRMVAEAVGFTGEIRTNLMELCRKSFYRIGGGAMRAPYVWRPHRDLDDAIAALEATGCSFSIDWFGAFKRWRVAISISNEFGEEADTLPLAACRAILAWKEAKHHD